MISLAFDDGWKSVRTRALPVLDKYGIKATFYVITRMPEFMLHERDGRLTADDLQELSRRGHEIGSHSQTHPNLVKLFPWKASREVFDSKVDLEGVGFSVSSFAYPYGWHSFWVRYFVKKSGYGGAREYGAFGYNNAYTDRFCLKTMQVLNTTTLKEIFEKILNCKSDEWLILTFHGIELDPGKWDTTEEVLEQICKYLKDTRSEVVTICDGLTMLK